MNEFVVARTRGAEGTFAQVQRFRGLLLALSVVTIAGSHGGWW